MTADLAARIHQHSSGDGSDVSRRHGLNRLVRAKRGKTVAHWIAQEKHIKRWRRPWKLALIEQANPDWRDLYDLLNG